MGSWTPHGGGGNRQDIIMWVYAYAGNLGPCIRKMETAIKKCISTELRTYLEKKWRSL